LIDETLHGVIDELVPSGPIALIEPIFGTESRRELRGDRLAQC